MWILYQLLMGLALALAGPVLLLTRGGHYRQTLPGRLGFYTGPRLRGPLWIHAVSVGEVGVAATLARSLPQEEPLLITTVTPTGQSRAKATFGGRGTVAYLPYDLGFVVTRFFRHFSPRALILVEGDLWPLVLRVAHRRRLPVFVVNGRIGDQSFRRMRRLRPLLPPLLARVHRFGVQSDRDLSRLLELGVAPERVVVTGNLKYETPEPPRSPELEARLGELAQGRPILVAGSTMPGEEEQVLKAFEQVNGSRRGLLILAPRHPERCRSVDDLLAGSELRTVRRSTLEANSAADVVLLDSVGELAGLYHIADAAFIGGTLVPTGGHNPLEAARYSVPIVVGPSMENFREMSEHFDRAQAWRRVASAGALAAVWREWLDHPEAARELGARAAAVVEAQRGALEKTLDLLAPVLQPSGPGTDAS